MDAARGTGRARSNGTHLLAPILLVVSTLLLTAPAEACGCICPPMRETFGRAEAVVIARFKERLSPTVHRYTVREWLRSRGPRRIVVIEPASRRDEGEPVGLALRHVGGNRYRAIDCGRADPHVARLASAPWERPSGKPPAALFVATALPGGSGRAGAWLDRSGRLLAWDNFKTEAFSVCPGGRLAVQLGSTRGHAREEVRVRDLISLDVVERIPLPMAAWEVDVTCRDEQASEILVLVDTDEELLVVDPRDGAERVRVDRGYHDAWMTLGRDAALIVESGPRADDRDSFKRVDLDTGTVLEVHDLEGATLRSYAIEPAADRVAILAFDPDTTEDIVTIVPMSSKAGIPATPITARHPSDATSSKRAEYTAQLVWTGAGRIALWAQRGGTVRLLDPIDLSVECEWPDSLAGVTDRRRFGLAPHADGGVLIGTSGPDLFVAHAAGGPFKRIHQFEPGPDRHVATLPAFDATALLGEPEPCAGPDLSAGRQ